MGAQITRRPPTHRSGPANGTNGGVIPRRSSPISLRGELERMVVADLLGPAGGEAEELDERNVRDRYLVGVLAPRPLPADGQGRAGADDDEDDTPLFPDELSEGGTDTADDGTTDQDVPV